MADQKSKNAQARLLRECAEGVESGRCVHSSGTMEI
jgi:hypothetical protein